MKFPSLIHVTREQPEVGPSWLEVHTDGVMSIDESGKEVAIYQLVSTARVSIKRGLYDQEHRRLVKSGDRRDVR